MTHGYRTRRLAVDYSIPLVTDVKCAKLLIEAMHQIGGAPKVKTHIDCVTSRDILKLPGFIDVHTHLREPGGNHKEDYNTGTAAALAGGVTMVLTMPNTNPSVTDKTAFTLVSDLARASARCDYAIYVGASSDNFGKITELAPHAAALKMYLNDTFSNLKLTDMTVWEKHLRHWPKRAPLAIHAEKQSIPAVLFLAHLLDRAVHICHVARKEEILIIRAAKERGVKVTCEVCPHHLFLSTDNVPQIGANNSEVRPMLCSAEDQKALWDNMDVIDVFATDHAPHTVHEKETLKLPGFPGLETILPLLLNAVNEKRLTIEDVINRFHRNPRRIFNLPEQHNTYVEVDMQEEWTIPERTRYCKSQWTPFAGMRVKGRVHRVVLRGETAYVDGEVLVSPGFGQNVREWPLKGSSLFHANSLERLPSVAISAVPGPGGDAAVPEVRFPNELFDTTSDSQTNDAFSKLLSERRPVSPHLPRIRLDSMGTQLQQSHAKPGSTLAASAQHMHNKHVLSVNMFTKEQLNDVFNLAQVFKERVSKDRQLDEVLRGKVMATMFFEASTRTQVSFGTAMLRLGGQVVNVDVGQSSVTKGETIDDSMAVLSGYTDIVVLRHPEPGAVANAARHCKKPIINAGDGVGEHPTQALLDIFTIREEIGTVNGLTVTMVGDLKHGRTVHSLARLLTLYNVQLCFVSPENLGMPQPVRDFLTEKGVAHKSYTDLEQVLPYTDVLYMTRIQRERFASEEEYKKVRRRGNGFILFFDNLVLILFFVELQQVYCDAATDDGGQAEDDCDAPVAARV